MKDVGLSVACVAALIGGLALYDSNADAAVPLAIWAAAPLALGLATARPWLFFVPLLVGFPASLLFGFAESATGVEAYVPVFGAIASAVGAVMVLVGAGIRSGGIYGEEPRR